MNGGWQKTLTWSIQVWVKGNSTNRLGTCNKGTVLEENGHSFGHIKFLDTNKISTMSRKQEEIILKLKSKITTRAINPGVATLYVVDEAK